MINIVRKTVPCVSHAVVKGLFSDIAVTAV